MNNLSAIGNIGQEPELRFLPDATPVLQFSFALTSGYGAKQVTTWLRCSLFGKRAETLESMLTKGTRVGITGELTNRPYADKSGVEKHSLELRVNDLTLLGSKSDSTGENVASQSQAMQSNGQDLSDLDSDFPF